MVIQAERLDSVVPERITEEAPFDIYVSHEKEHEYCQTHGIDLRRLQNGITLVGMNRFVEDRVGGGIVYHFPQGAYTEPKGREGIAHLFEHMVAKNALKQAMKHRADANAHTLLLQMTFELEGIANEEVREYGIWPVIPVQLNSIANPLSDIDDIEKKLESEKGVVYREIERDNMPGSKIDRFYNETLYDPVNPFRYRIPGTKESVASITLADLQQFGEQMLIPDGLIVTVFTEGTPEKRKQILDELEQQLINFPRSDRKKVRVNPKLQELLNVNFEQGGVYQQAVSGMEGLVQVGYVWFFPMEKHSIASMASSKMMEIIGNRFFDFMRDNEISYDPRAGVEQIENLLRVDLSFSTESGQNISSRVQAEIYEKMKEYVFGGITDEELKDLDTFEHLKQKATPMSIEERFKFVVGGLIDKNKIVDPDKVLSLVNATTAADYKSFLGKLQTVPPAVLIAGDIDQPQEQKLAA